MPPDHKHEGGTERAVVDRIVDGQAVLLVGEDEREQIVPAQLLPAGVGEGDVLLVSVHDDELEVLGTDPGAADEQRKQMRSRMERLRDRSRRFGEDR